MSRRLRGIDAALCAMSAIGSELSSLEVASGAVFGRDLDPIIVGNSPRRDANPRRALEEAILRALLRPPALISFSGGRDSSALLALGVHVARRDGLPLPVPVTLRYPGFPESEETEWQDLAIGHLGITDWEIVRVRDELDYLGPVARHVLRSHGLLWPGNAYAHYPLFRRASSGSVITGVDGDGLFGAWRWRRLGAALAGRSTITPRDIFRWGLAHSPRLVKQLVDGRRRVNFVTPWLHPHVARMVTRTSQRENASEPARWEARIRWWATRRYLNVARRSLQTIADEFSVEVVNPFLDGEFLAHLAGISPRGGLGDRTSYMRYLFADLLPDEVLTRLTKAYFGNAFWRRWSREFVASWEGQGIDRTLVDAEALRRIWNEPKPDNVTVPLMQSVWLSRASEGISEEGVNI